MKERLEWKVHTHGLFKEILNGRDSAILRNPLNIMQGILREVATRAIELDDRKLNVLMMRLSLYAISDPDDPKYDPLTVEHYVSQVRKSEKEASEFKAYLRCKKPSASCNKCEFLKQCKELNPASEFALKEESKS
jgi:hypothetical protein